MKVLCINNSEFGSCPIDGTKPIVHEGNVYNVVDECISPLCKKPCYEFAEHIGYIYSAEYFIPVSDIEDDILNEDQLEEIRERQLVKI